MRKIALSIITLLLSTNIYASVDDYYPSNKVLLPNSYYIKYPGKNDLYFFNYNSEEKHISFRYNQRPTTNTYMPVMSYTSDIFVQISELKKSLENIKGQMGLVKQFDNF